MGGGCFLGDGPGHSDEDVVFDAVGAQILGDVLLALAPLANRRVLSEEQQRNASNNQHDQRHDERQPPGLVHGVAAGAQGVVDGRHDKVRDAAAGVAPAARKRIRGADNILIKKAGGPHLTRHEGPAQDADEKADGVQAAGGLDERREADGDGADEEGAGEDFARAEEVAQGAGDEADEEAVSGCGGQYLSIGSLCARGLGEKLMVGLTLRRSRRCLSWLLGLWSIRDLS